MLECLLDMQFRCTCIELMNVSILWLTSAHTRHLGYIWTAWCNYRCSLKVLSHRAALMQQCVQNSFVVKTLHCIEVVRDDVGLCCSTNVKWSQSRRWRFLLQFQLVEWLSVSATVHARLVGLSLLSSVWTSYICVALLLPTSVWRHAVILVVTFYCGVIECVQKRRLAEFDVTQSVLHQHPIFRCIS